MGEETKRVGGTSGETRPIGLRCRCPIGQFLDNTEQSQRYTRTSYSFCLSLCPLTTEPTLSSETL